VTTLQYSDLSATLPAGTRGNAVDKLIRRWHSPNVGRELGVARWGHYGKPVIFFPTGGGDFLDCERFQMVRALTPLIEAGRIKLYAPDAVCRWGWANKEAPPRTKSMLQASYDRYLMEELIPFIREDCGGTDQKLGAAGASIGAYNALNAVTKHPEQFDVMVGMSGTYVMDRRMHGHWDEDYYYNQPTQFVPNLPDDEQLSHLRQARIVLALGQNYENPDYTNKVAAALKARSVPHHVVVWGKDSGHDWPTWRTMLPLFLHRLV
jgi:esterase/lipase superfamily enzyme